MPTAANIEHARLLFFNLDALKRQIADTEATLKRVRKAHYPPRAGVPSMDQFRREVGA